MVGEFVGRESDLERINTLLKGPNHFITIHGFGGIGKTALALQVAQAFDAGKVLALPLVGTPKLDDVIRKIARFLYVDMETTSDLEEQKWEVIEKLRNEETILLYLDNVEDVKHALDQGSTEAKSLMKFFRQIPNNVKILATSRIALGWPNEQLVDLDGLTPHDGAQVFRQWTPQRLDDIDDSRAMRLSYLVNGHPLSLRLLGGMFNECQGTHRPVHRQP